MDHQCLVSICRTTITHLEMSFEDVFALSFTHSSSSSVPMLSDSPSGLSVFDNEPLYEELLESQPLVVLDDEDHIFTVDEDYKYAEQPAVTPQRPQKAAAYNDEGFADAAQHNYRLWLANVR